MLIYKCINLIDNKIYIGKTNNFKKRKNMHIYNNVNSYLHNAIKKYGKNNFKWTILNRDLTNDEANKLEIFWIDYFQSNNSKLGYNMTIGGDGNNFWKDKNLSKEHRYNISKSLKGKYIGENSWMYGKKHSEKQGKKCLLKEKEEFLQIKKERKYQIHIEVCIKERKI